LATANSRILPVDRLPSAYNNDESGPNRVLRIERGLRHAFENGGLDGETSASLQMDIVYEHWAEQRVRLGGHLCNPERQGADATVERARRILCDWNGDMAADSVGSTLYVLVTNALIDRAFADDLPGGARNGIWSYTQALPQFEANVHRMWLSSADEPFWDDVTTPRVETRADILEAALADAVAYGRGNYGADIDHWQWGRVRPFVLAHAFAAEGGLLGVFFNTRPIAIGGDTETAFKQQFPRSDREHMRPAIGPLVRLTVDLADPWKATYSMAGGESGWPGSAWYANLVDDWSRGVSRPLTPEPSKDDIDVTLLP
jgi:penicillin amidase